LEAVIREVLDLLIRWIHVIAGILWIGNSMLFNWLDRNLEPREGAPEGFQGEMWMVHSGGFYQVEKKLLPPGQLPERLHWFKWQNGATWISGICLLAVVYYMGGAAYMLDPSVSNIGLGAAIALGIAVLIGSWFIYDFIWSSPLGKKAPLAFVLSFTLLALLTYGLCHVLSGRAAYIHIGAMLGTLMTANVWLRILPAQDALIAETKAGEKQDPALGYRAKQRSIHNNYMTYPVIFIMISNHFPGTYSNPLAWLILVYLMLAGAGVRHFLNIRFTFKGWLAPIFAIIAALAVLLFFFFSRQAAPSTAPMAGAATVPFSEAHTIITQRCLSCHSQTPTDSTFTQAPQGIRFDTPEEIQAQAAAIKTMAVDSHTMPLGNKTNMTDSERAVLGAWLAAGAKINERFY
jgi:uncharacterized membrane protein